MIGANKDGAAGISGLVPGPAAEEYSLFLRGDGTWAAPEVDHTVLTLENTNKNTHSDLIAEATNSITPISGDIVIIKDPIAADKFQYTAYVYDNFEWHAMDGNYNAENVYFSEDLLTTSAVGNIVLDESGQATIAAAGKNLKEVFNAIFVKEENPEITDPSVSLIFTQGNKNYEVGTEINPQYSATLDPGSYSYGPATGITVSSWEISDSQGNTATAFSGTMPTVTLADNMKYTITAKANYLDGAIPLTNLKNPYTEGQIKAGSVSTVSSQMKAYRPGFYGTLTEKEDLTSDIIRSLSKTASGLYVGSTTTVTIPLEALRVVFAYPESLGDLDSVTDTNGLNAEILDGFTKINVDVNGANNYEAISYNVYYIDYANPNDKTNSYKFKI